MWITKTYHKGRNRGLCAYFKNTLKLLKGVGVWAVASGFYISRPQSYNEEELENDMDYSARSRNFMRGEKGEGRGKISARPTPISFAHSCYSPKKKLFWKKKLPSNRLGCVKFKWPSNIVVTAEHFKRCVLRCTKHFPFRTTGYIILQMRGEKTMMLWVFYAFRVVFRVAFRVFTKKRVYKKRV